MRPVSQPDNDLYMVADDLSASSSLTGWECFRCLGKAIGGNWCPPISSQDAPSTTAIITAPNYSSGRGTADADRMVWRSVWLSKPGLLIVLEHATRLVPAAHRPTRVGVGP
jgi:hypothetical protein